MVWDPAAARDEAWVPVGAPPGFLCGVVYSAVLGITEGRARLGEVPWFRAGAWGTVSGLMVGALPFMIGTPTTDLRLWLLGAEIVGPVTLLSTVSAVASALVAGTATRRDLRRGVGSS
jgi:hypothetical protein